MFGAAVSGMKRGARELGDGAGSGAGEGRQLQRARYDGPAGGRGGNGGRSLFDRVNGNNPQFAPGRSSGPVNNTGMPQPAFDAVRRVSPCPTCASVHRLTWITPLYRSRRRSTPSSLAPTLPSSQTFPSPPSRPTRSRADCPRRSWRRRRRTRPCRPRPSPRCKTSGTSLQTLSVPPPLDPQTAAASSTRTLLPSSRPADLAAPERGPAPPVDLRPSRLRRPSSSRASRHRTRSASTASIATSRTARTVTRARSRPRSRGWC